MKHRNRQEDLQYRLCQQAEKPSYMSVSICFVDILIPTYFQINIAFILFIWLVQVCLTVLQNLNHYEAS